MARCTFHRSARLFVGGFLFTVLLAATGGAATQIVYVRSDAGAGGNGTSWASAYNSLATAIGAVTPTGDNPVEMWIADGVYLPTTSTGRTSAFELKSNLTLRGGFVGTESTAAQRPVGGNQTVLSGDIGSPDPDRIEVNTPIADPATIAPVVQDNANVTDNSYNVLRAVNVGGVTLDRLVITGGSASNSATKQALVESMVQPSSGTTGYIQDLDPDVTGAGLYALNSALTIVDCTFARNVSRGIGGAIVGRGGQIVIHSSRFIRNDSGFAGGAVALQDILATVGGNLLYGNGSAHLGGALFIQSSVGPATLRAYEGQVLLTLASTTYAAQQLANGPPKLDPKNPLNYYRLGGATFTIGSTVAKEAFTSTGALTGTTGAAQAATLISADAGIAVAGFAAAYSVVSIAFAAVDIGVQLALILGANPNDPFIHEWVQISAFFNSYLTPVGLLISIAKAILGPEPVDHVARATDIRNAEFAERQNTAAGLEFVGNRFELNSAGGVGGAVAVIHANVNFSASWFINNEGKVGGAAAALFVYNNVNFESSAFIGNQSYLGHSGVSAGSRSVVRLVNDAFVKNHAATAGGRALSVETGADAFVGNSVFWGNTAGPSNTVGADVFASRRADLDPVGQKAYDDSGDSHGAIVGTCNIRYSNIQGLGTLVLGTEKFENLAFYDSPNGFEVADQNPNIGEGIRPSVLASSQHNFTREPILTQDIFPHPLSPLVDAGDWHITFRSTNGTSDIVGAPRNHNNGPIDIGPVESDGNFAAGTVLYVDSQADTNGDGLSWTTAFNNLPSALAAPLAPGSSIWVAFGSYYPTSGADRSVTLNLRPGVSLIGGFKSGDTSVSQSSPVAQATIISGNIGSSNSSADNSRTLLTGVTVDGDADLATIPRVLQGLYFTEAEGGSAVSCVSPLVVKNCVFHHNGATGRALAITSGQSNNSYSVQIVDSTFENNPGGAIDSGVFNVDVLRSNFFDNTAPVGAALYFHAASYDRRGTTKIERSVFVGNAATAGRGGAIYFEGPSLLVAQSVLADNTASPAGGDTSDLGGAGLWQPAETDPNSRGQITLTNSIFVGNRLTGTFAATTIERQQLGLPVYATYQNAPVPVITGNDIEGLTSLAAPGGTGGNVDYDPFFVNAAGDDFRLSDDSMLLNRGVTYQSGSDASVLFGVSGDIGAFENFNTSAVRATLGLTFTAQQPGEAGRTFTFTLTSPLDGMSNFVWEVKRPGGAAFVTVTSDAYTSGLGTSTLTLTNPPQTWSGSRYRLRLLNTDGKRSITDAVVLVAPPSFLFVKSGGAGTKDGTSWDNAMASPSDALAIAVAFTQIFVAGGDYTMPFSGMQPGVMMYGGFAGTETTAAQRTPGAHETILRVATNASWLNIAGVATYPTTPTPTVIPNVIDGFTLKNAPGVGGGGIASGSANLRLTNLRFNFAGIARSAISDDRSTLYLANCEFTDGTAAMLDLSSSILTVSHCTFSNNGVARQGQWAGAIAAEGSSSLTISDTTFSNNFGYHAGAIDQQLNGRYASAGGLLTVERCRFLDNGGGSAGAIYLDSPGATRVANSLFARNYSVSTGGPGGGALAMSRAAAVAVVQCTLVANISQSYGSAIDAIYGGSYTLANSIVWANQGPQLLSGAHIITNSIIQGNSYDPLLDSASADYALALGSPLINQGGSSSTLSGSTDLSGNNRFAGGAADLGASEFAAASPSAVYVHTKPADQAVFVERPATFTIDASLGANTGTTPVTWEYLSGSNWLPVSGLSGWTVNVVNGISTLANPSVTSSLNGQQFRAVISAASSVAFTATLTVKPRIVLFVDSRVANSGNGSSWANALKTIGEALAAATGDTDIWVATGDYTENDLTPPFGARLYLGFTGTENDVTLRDPVANPIRIGSPLADRTLVTDDVTTFLPPLPLSAGQTARWQVDTGNGTFVDLVADAWHTLSLVNGIPGLAIKGNPAFVNYRYRVVISDNTGEILSSVPATVTVISRSTVYVDASASGGAHTGADWANAFNDLSAALAAYPAFADFKVAEGTYVAPDNSSFFLRRSLTLAGGYVAGTDTRDPVAHRTILASPGSATSFATTVDTKSDRGAVDSLTVLDGFVFRNAGLGINLHVASPVIRHCRFEGLVTALAVTDSSPAVETSTFLDSFDTTITTRGATHLTIAGCDFERNGVGIPNRTVGIGSVLIVGQYATSGANNTQVSVAIADSTFTNNLSLYGDGIILVSNGASLELVRSIFTANGGGIYSASSSQLNIRQSLFAGNTGLQVVRNDGPLDLSYSTFADNNTSNTAVYAGAAITLRDSILWGNQKDGQAGGEAFQFSQYQGSRTLANNVIQGLKTLSGTNLLPFDPRFVDSAHGNYQLAADSPAVDAGNAADLLDGETDLSGLARTVGVAPDLGAYEAATTAAPVYSFNLPASLSAPPGSVLSLAYTAPIGSSVVWQYSTDGDNWTSINPSGGAASASPPGVTQTLVQSLSQLSLNGIQPALNGVSLRAVLTVGATTYASAAVPVTVVAFESLYVDASVSASGDGLTWSTAFKTFSEALAAIDVTHRLINLAEGTYRPSASAPDLGSFRLTSLEVRGGFPVGGGTRDPAAHPTILTGLPLVGDDPRAEVVVRIAAGGLFPTLLDGVTVENGQTGLTVDGTSPTLSNLIVRGHIATGLVLTGFSGRVESSLFENNAGVNGGAIHLVGGAPILDRVTVRGNTASNGGGIFIESPYGTYTFTSLLVTGNVADVGGGIHAGDGQPSLDQVTLAGNRARLGAAIYVTGGQARLRNSIVWGNVATAGGADPQLDGQYGAEYSFRNSDRVDLEQGSLTDGFVRIDPLFVSPVDAANAPTTAGDYRLRDISPAIDAGANGVVTGLTLDVAGHTRLVGTVDLGAYESSVTGVTPLFVTAQPANLTYHRDLTGNTFTVASSGATSIAWEYAAPGGAFTSLTDVSGFTGADTASLTVSALAPSLNGYRFRAAITGADGSVIHTDERILTVYSPRYYVNAGRSGTDAGDGLSWATAFRSLDGALALPFDPEGTELWLAAGDYTPASSFVLRPRVSLYGGFVGNETNLAARNPAAHVVSLVGGAGSAPIVSISIDQPNYPVLIDGVTIRDAGGYGIQFVNNRVLNLSQVRFSGLGTALYQRAGTVTITGGIFTGNTIAIYASLGALTVQQSEFRGNGGANGDPVVTIASGTVELFENCLFSGNTTTSLSFNANSNATVRHVTFADNLGGAALSAGSSFVTLQNSIVWGNRTAGSSTIPAQIAGTPSVASTANSIELVTGATPVFVSPIDVTSAPSTGGDYQLAGTSHTIETGNNSYSNTSGVDLAGAPRLHGAHVDPGAYEYQSDPYFITSPTNAVGTPGAPARYTVSATASVESYAWDESTDGSTWTPLVESSAYAGVATATLTVNGDATFAGHLYRARLQFPDGPELASDAARFDYLGVASTATAGFATPALFTASATGDITSYAWQVSVNGGGFTSISDNASYSGATTNVLTVNGDSTFTNRTYRASVTFSGSPAAVSNSVAFPYADFTSAPSGVARGGMLAYGTSSFAFDLPGGIDQATLTDASLTVHTQLGGRLDLAALQAPAFNGDTVTLGFIQSLHAGELVSVTTTSALHRADGVGARPQVWQFRNGVRSGSGIFDAAAPLTGAPAGATALALADLDGNGRIDAVVAGAAGNQVYLNDGSGQFAASGSPFGAAGAVSIVLGSFTSAGALDAAIANADGSIGIWSNNGAGVFSLVQTVTGESATALALGDLDGDGDLDLFVARTTGNRVYLNDGSGTFTATGGVFGSGAGVSVALGDVDNDGRLDALVGSGSTSALWINQGNAVFTGAPQSFAGRPADRVALGDFDQDGLLDLVFTRANTPTQIWRNQGNNSFVAATTSVGGGTATLATGDVDGDGRLDVVLTDATGAVRTWSGQSSGGFLRAANQPALAFGNRAALVDLDGDGALDLIGLDPSGTPVVSLYRIVASIGNEDIDLPLAPAGFTREGGDSVTHVKIASLPAQGFLHTTATPTIHAAVGDTFTLSDAAALIYTPGVNLNGFDSFTWLASVDGGGTFGPTAIPYWLIVVPVADNVVPMPDAATVPQRGTVTTLTGGATSVLANDLNVDEGTTLIASLVVPPAHGTLTLHADGTFSYTHNGSETRSDQFVYRARNTTSNLFADATVTIAIANVNDAPTAVTFAAGATLYTAQPAGAVAGTLTAADPDLEDAGLLTFSLVAGSGDTDNAEFVLDGATLETAAPLDFAAGLTRSVRVRATDPAGLFVESVVTLALTRAPEATTTLSFSANEDTAVATTLSGVGGVAALTYEVVTAPANGSLTGSGTALTYHPNPNFNGPDSFTFRVSDGVITSAPATVSLTIIPVNDAPTLADSALPDTTDDTAISATLAGFDADNDALQYWIELQGQYGNASINGSTLTYTPRRDILPGVAFDYVTVYAYDPSGLRSDSRTVQVRITPVNDAPILAAAPLSRYDVLKGQIVSFVAAITDYDSSFTTLRVGTAPAHGSVSIAADHSFVYTPNIGFAGDDSFTLYANDSDLDSNAITVNVRVTDPAPTASNTAVSGNQRTVLQNFLNGFDPQGDVLTATIVTGPAHGTANITRYGNATYAVSYSPEAAFFGTDSLTFTMSDPGGNVSAPATATFTVNEVNEAPVAIAASKSQSGLLPTMDLMLAGTDYENSPLTYRIVTPPAHGTLIGTGPGFTYSLTAAPFEGTDSFTYVVNDGAKDSAPATVSLTFINDHPNPIAVADSATVYRDLWTSIPVLANDSDPWGNPFFIVSVTQGAHGTVTKNGAGVDGFVTYQHNGDDATFDSFTYTLSNFSDYTTTQTVFVTISDHVINVTSTADSGPGSLREAIETVNRLSFATWTIQLLPYQPPGTLDLDHTKVLDTIGESDPALGDSALLITGNVTIQGYNSSRPIILQRAAYAPAMRVLHIAPAAVVTLKDLSIVDGVAHQGGGIYNEGTLTLDHVTLDGNTAQSLDSNPGLGGGLVNHNGSVTLDHATFTGNVADDAGGLYNVAEGFPNFAHVIATSATFSGHGAAADFRSVSVSGGEADLVVGDLTAETPTAPWFDVIPDTTINRHFSIAVPVLLDAGQAISFTPDFTTSGYRTVTITGSGGSRAITATFDAGTPEGAHPVDITASGGGVTFKRTMNLTIDSGSDRPPIARDDHIVVAAGEQNLPLTALALLNDEDPDGTPLFNIDIVGNPSVGTITYIAGQPYYSAPNGATGTTSLTYVDQAAGSNTATIYITFQSHSVDITTSADSGAGSLRAGIDLSNNYPAQPWTFQPAGLGTPEVDLATAGESDSDLGASAFVITGDVTIDGANQPGFLIRRADNAPAMRLFHVAAGATLTLRNVTLENGLSPSGGAIYNEGTVVLDHATLQSNTASVTGTSAGGRGGAIYNAGGTVTVTDSSLLTNTAASVDDTLRGLGGAIYTRNGTVTLTGSSLTENIAADGGALYAEGNAGVASVTFASSTLARSDASADLQGGTANGGQVVFHRRDSSIDRISGPWISSLTTFVLGSTDNLTFLTNDDAPGLVLSAISSNQGIVPNSGLTIASTDVAHTLSVVADHAGIVDIDVIASSEGVDFHETFTAHANSGAVSNPTVYPQSTAPIYAFQSTIIDPILGKVYDADGHQLSGGNGAASDPYDLPLFVSDVGQPAHGTATITDDGRILYTHTDADYRSGTDEFTYTVSNGFGGTASSGVQITIQATESTVTNIGELNAAIATANAQPSTPWAIHIVTGANQTWTTQGYFSGNGYYSAFKIDGNITLDATASPGFALTIPPGGFSGPPARAFLVIAGAQLELKDLTITGGTAYSSPPPAKGGAVLNFGTFAAENVTFANNGTYVTGFGGALYNDGGTVTLTDCSFQNNSTNTGGTGGAIASRNGSLSLTRVTFSNNAATTAADLYVLGDGATATLILANTDPGSHLFETQNGGTLAVTGLLSASADTLDRSLGQAATVTTGTLLANDTGDTLTFVSADATSANGVAITVADGVLTYAASALTDDDSFTYTIQDEHGATTTGTVTVQILNHAPVAVDYEVTRDSRENAMIDIATLLAHNTDADGDTLTFDSADFYSEQHASIDVSDGVITYSTGSPIMTDDSFTYTFHDSHGATATGTVIVHVTTVPDVPPVLTITARSGGGVVLELAGAPHTSYVISLSTDLANWEELTTVTTDANGLASTEDTVVPNEGAARFYRAESN